MSNLKKLNEAALAEIARGLELSIDPTKMSKAELIAAIEKVEQPHEEIEENQENEAPAPKRVKREPKRYKIIVHNQEGVDNTPFIKVGVNGVMYQITREKEVIVNEGVKHVLDTAIMTVFRQEGRQMVAQDVRRFPYTVLEVL
jgi:phosphotransferase system IIB component